MITVDSPLGKKYSGKVRDKDNQLYVISPDMKRVPNRD